MITVAELIKALSLCNPNSSVQMATARKEVLKLSPVLNVFYEMKPKRVCLPVDGNAETLLSEHTRIPIAKTRNVLLESRQESPVDPDPAK